MNVYLLCDRDGFPIDIYASLEAAQAANPGNWIDVFGCSYWSSDKYEIHRFKLHGVEPLDPPAPQPLPPPQRGTHWLQTWLQAPPSFNTTSEHHAWLWSRGAI